MRARLRSFFAEHGMAMLLFAVFLAIFFWFLNAQFPKIGHDFFLFFPRLLAGQWHFARQGLMPFRFDPHFCGGLPVYGNPQDVFYSLLQLLSLKFDLWQSTQAYVLLILLWGYAGWYLFGRDYLRFQSHWSHALALAVTASGFHLMHTIVGHVTFYGAPLIGFLLWLLFDPQIRRLQTTAEIVRAAAFGLTCAFILYAGGYIVLMLLLLAVAIVLPVDAIVRQEHLRARAVTLVTRWPFYGFSALLLCGSKLVAIWSFMRFVPRHVSFFEFDPNASTLAYFVRAFFGFPQTGALYDILHQPMLAAHELSFFLSPAAIVGLGFGLGLGLKNRAWMRTHRRLVIASACYGFLLLWIFVQIARGYGPVMTLLGHLPILKSTRGISRFVYGLSLLVLVTSFVLLAKSSRAFLPERRQRIAALAVSIFTIGGFYFAYRPLVYGLEWSPTLNIAEVRHGLEGFSNFRDHAVLAAIDLSGTRASDFNYILKGFSGVTCYEQLHDPDRFAPIVSGGVHWISDGYFNLRNPACLQYPKENDCRPGDRIAAFDRENLMRFARGEKTTWKVSMLQRVSDWVSLFALVLGLGVLGAAAVHRIRPKRTSVRIFMRTL